MNPTINNDALIKKIIPSPENNYSLAVEFPLVFQNITIGPKGLDNVSIEKIVVNNQELTDVSDVTIHTYNRRVINETLCATTIENKPVKFQSDENNDDNTLVFKFLLNDIDDILEFNAVNLRNVPFTIHLNMFFTNSQKLELVVHGEIANHNTGAVTMLSLKRKKIWHVTKVNLSLLILLIGSLTYWNYFLNRDVYQPNEYFSQEIITGILGVLITFFGLSMKKMKSIFSVFTHTKAFFKYPELHLSLEQFVGVSSPSWLIALAIVTLGSSLVVYENWSTDITDNPNFEIYDSLENKKVENYSRIYNKDFIPDRFSFFNSNKKFKNGRFILINSDNNSSEGGVFKFGAINNYGVAKDGLFTFQYLKRNTSDSLITLDVLASNLRNNMLLGNIKVPFKEMLKTYPKHDLNDFFIEYNDINFTDSLMKRKIVIQKHRFLEKDDLEVLIKSFKVKNFKLKNKEGAADIIFANRAALQEKLVEIIRGKIGDRYLIDLKTIIDVSLKEIASINNTPKKAIERSIILTALWKMIEEEDVIRGKPTKSDILSICNAINPVLKNLNNWKMDRSIMGFLIELHKQAPNNINTHPITFIDSLIANGGRHINRRDFIVVSAIKNSTSSTQIQRLNKKYIKHLKEKHGFEFDDDDLFELIVKTEKSDARKKDFVKDHQGILNKISHIIRKQPYNQ